MAKEGKKLTTVKKVYTCHIFLNNVNKQLLYVPIVYIIGDETMEPYSAGFDYKEPIEEKSDVKIGVEWQLIHVKEAGS